MLGHGASRFVRERLFEKSDKFNVVICEKCGEFSTTQNECKACGTENVAKINMPFACKLLISEIESMGIKMKITTK
jgi:DNA-directed RNA polymerase beta subunit